MLTVYLIAAVSTVVISVTEQRVMNGRTETTLEQGEVVGRPARVRVLVLLPPVTAMKRLYNGTVGTFLGGYHVRGIGRSW